MGHTRNPRTPEAGTGLGVPEQPGHLDKILRSQTLKAGVEVSGGTLGAISIWAD